MSSTSSLVLQAGGACDQGIIDQINELLRQAGKTTVLCKLNSAAQVGAKVLEVDVYAYTIEKNSTLVADIEEAVRAFRDDIGEQDGEIVLLVTDDDGFTRITRPGQGR